MVLRILQLKLYVWLKIYLILSANTGPGSRKRTFFDEEIFASSAELEITGTWKSKFYFIIKKN